MNTYLRFILVILACAYFWVCAKTYMDWHFIDGANLIFHEAGHTMFFFLGTFVKVAAGSIFQVALPLFISFYFFGTGQKVSGALCLLWAGQSLLNVSVYAGDAVMMQLNLLGGDSVMHDWNYLLSTLGILRHTQTIALCMRIIGFATIFGGTVLTIYYSVTGTKTLSKKPLS